MNDRNWFNEFSTAVDKNKRQIQYAIYAVSFGGFIYAVRSVRPFQKFRHAKDIPKTFIDRNLTLNGSVTKIDVESDVLLRVDHKPIFLSRIRRKSDPGLAVKIKSVNVSSNGISWLQHVVQGEGIRFTLLKREGDKITCIVRRKEDNVAEELLKLGFATVDTIDFDLEKNKIYSKYYRKLLKLEDNAEKQRVGIWSSKEYSRFEKVKAKVNDIIRNIFYKMKNFKNVS